MVPMSIDLYVVLLAVLKIGSVAVFVDPWIGRRQIAEFAALAEPAAFIGIGRSHLLRLADARLRSIPCTVTTGRAAFGVPAGRTLRQLRAASGDGAVEAVAPDDPALVTFTTGSSGAPKGANRTHGYLLAQHTALQTEFPYSENDIDLTMFPVFALNNLAKGIPTIVPSIDFRRVAQADGSALLRRIRQEVVTTMTASPPLVDALQSAVEGTTPLSSLRRVLVGGAPVTDDQLRRWRRALPETEVVVVYGSTEAEPVAHIDADERLRLSGGVVARPLGYCAGIPTSLLETRIVRICDDPIHLGELGWEAWELPKGEVGELVVTGDHVGKDYYLSPEATAANKIRDTEGRIWHRMGDTGFFDDESRFWLAGRVHSTIYRRGTPFHPQLVEQAAAGQGVRRAAALGVSDVQLGQRLVVVVQVDRSDKELADAVAQRLGETGFAPDEVVLTCRALPVDPRHNSKVDYPRLRAMLENGGLEPTCRKRRESATNAEEGQAS